MSGNDERPLNRDVEIAILEMELKLWKDKVLAEIERYRIKRRAWLKQYIERDTE